MSIINPDQTAHIGPAPAASPTEPVAVEAPPVESTEAEQTTFDRAYVEDLRNEAAKYRVRAKEYEQAFGEMPEDVRAGWLQMVQLAQDEDPQAREYLREILGFEQAQQLIEEVEPAETPLTREDYAQIAREEAQALFSEQAQVRAEADAIAGVQAQAKGLGYDPTSPDYVLLLKFANDMTQPDLAAAHEEVLAYKRSEWEAYESRKATEAGQSPTIPSGNGVAPNLVQPPKTFEEARDRLHERLMQGG